MNKKRAFIGLFLSLCLAFGLMGAAQATQSYMGWININNGTSYCGVATASVNNTKVGANTNQYVVVRTAATSIPNCIPQGAPLDLPADYVRVSASLRCTYTDIAHEWVGATWPLVSNPNHSALIITGGNSGGCNGANPFTIKARAVVTSWYYIFPSGWQTFARTTDWVLPT